jgi:hypothetical protein
MDREHFVATVKTFHQIKEEFWVFIPQIQPLQLRLLPKEALLSFSKPYMLLHKNRLSSMDL